MNILRVQKGKKIEAYKTTDEGFPIRSDENLSGGDCSVYRVMTVVVCQIFSGVGELTKQESDDLKIL